MPRQGRFNHDEKTEAAKLLEMRINKKLLQQHWTSSTGKVVVVLYYHCIKSLFIHLYSSGSTVELYTNDENEIIRLFLRIVL